MDRNLAGDRVIVAGDETATGQPAIEDPAKPVRFVDMDGLRTGIFQLRTLHDVMFCPDIGRRPPICQVRDAMTLLRPRSSFGKTMRVLSAK